MNDIVSGHMVKVRDSALGADQLRGLFREFPNIRKLLFEGCDDGTINESLKPINNNIYCTINTLKSRSIHRAIVERNDSNDKPLVGDLLFDLIAVNLAE